MNIYNLTLKTTASNLTVDTVGVQEAPEDPTQNGNARIGDDGTDGGTGNENGDDSTDGVLEAKMVTSYPKMLLL